MSSRGGVSISVGSFQLNEAKGEDRVHVSLTYSTEGRLNLSSFGVYDGHNGSLASQFCSVHFHNRVDHRFNALTESALAIPPGMIAGLPDDDQLDAIMCESIRTTCLEMNENLWLRCEAGTTLCVLFALSDHEKRISRLYCANVGDSRCVLYTTAVAQPSRCRNTGHSARVGLSQQPTDYVPLMENSVYAMSEDHALSNPKELARMQSTNRMEPAWIPFPKVAQTSENPDNAGQRDAVAYSSFVSLISAAADGVESDILIDGDLPNEELEPRYRELHSQSFVGRRDAGDGVEAVFSRYRVSLNMTRSVGDKYGPRCCLAVPEVTGTVVTRALPVRVVLASDGLWDVMSSDDVRQLVFLHSDPNVVAKLLVDHSAVKRRRQGLRADDISALVVDVNCAGTPAAVLPCCPVN